MKDKTTLLIVVLAAISLASCSSTALNPMPREMDKALGQVTGQDGRACLRIRDITGYGTVSDSVISAGLLRRDHALMVTSFRCPQLETSSAAIFDGTFTEICGGGRDFVLTAGERCSIRSIFEFEDRDAAFEALDRAEELIRNTRDEAEEK